MAKEYRVNELIRSREVRVIGEQGEQLGVLPVAQALQMARERGLDLVEVAPTSVPPVCRILDYGKFRYEQAKKEKEARKSQKVGLLREIRFRTRISAHDKASKIRHIRELLREGNKIKLSVVFRGREITHPELGVSLMRSVAEALKDEARLEAPPAMEGRSLTLIMTSIPRPEVRPGPAPEKEHGEEAKEVKA